MSDKPRLYTVVELDQRKKDLEEIKYIFDTLGLRFFLIDGVLLGALREKNFIRWDWDVELAVLEEEMFPYATRLLNALYSNGFEIINVIPFSPQLKINIKKRSVQFSIVGLKLYKNKWRYRSQWRYPAAFFLNPISVNFLGAEYLVPNPPIDILKFIYGRWDIPLRTSTHSLYLNSAYCMPAPLRFLIKVCRFFNSLDSYSLRLRMGISSLFFPRKREYLFSHIMLKRSLTNNCVFIKIGSSDGLELSNAISFTNGMADCYLIEPSSENLERSRSHIENISRKYNKKVTFINGLISDHNGYDDYWFCKDSPNLSSILSAPLGSEKRTIDSVTIESFIGQYKIGTSRHIVIMMDIEGAEVKILKSSIDILKQVKKVSILLEIHPELYHKGEMEWVLEELFKIGFSPRLVESAWIPRPEMFIERLMEPISCYNNRALYEDVDEQLIKKAASRPVLNISNLYPYFTKKIIRSLLLEKR